MSIKKLRIQNKKNKELKKKDILFGKNSIIEALKNGLNIDSIWISQTARDVGEIMELAKRMEVPIKKVPVQKIDYLIFPFYKAHEISHQGVVAILNEYDYAKVDDIYNMLLSEGKTPFFVLLDRITDVGNFGAIARSAVCFDVDAIIIPNKNSVSVNAQANKSSAGALSHIPICRVDNLWDTIDYLIQCGFQLIGAAEKGDQSIGNIDLNLPTLLVLGNENTGISLPVQKMLNHQIKIPMNVERFDSLNVSVAAGILFHQAYEIRKGSQ